MMLISSVKQNIKLEVQQRIDDRKMFCDKDIANSIGYSTEYDIGEVNEEIYRLWSMGFFPSNYRFKIVKLKYSVLRDSLAYSDYIVFYPMGLNPKEHPCPYERKKKK